MITTRTSGKIAKEHLSREAIIYIRQSRPHQVRDNRESGERQYNLAERASVLGWPAGSITTVDEDQGARRPPPTTATGSRSSWSRSAPVRWGSSWRWRPRGWPAPPPTGTA